MISSQDFPRVEPIQFASSLKRLKISEDLSTRAEMEACCMWHRIMLVEDFESESEADETPKEAGEAKPLAFLSQYPPEVEHELFRLVSTEEKTTQTNLYDPMPLSAAANFSVFGTKATLPEIKGSSKRPMLQHRIKLSIKGSISSLSRGSEQYFGIPCHNCNRVFKSHQALGGHLSRKHR
mmetsp:Transcript_12440/g.23525  ORF Transcript_12440/g.23525 Transcript_12440/m.23525 type:complete len:180 (-) Transcript_12440:100-639(-)